MSIKATLAAIRALGLCAQYSAEWHEFRVSYQGNPASTYYTDDREDALATARHMAGN